MSANGTLALDGGAPVRTTPLPQEWCGAHYMDQEEIDAVARVQLRKLDRIIGAMRSPKNRIKQVLGNILTFREVLDPEGDGGSFLMTVFPARAQSLMFTEALRAEGIVADKDGLYPVHMDQWGLHIYYNVASLVNKRGLSAISPWDLAENRASADVAYGRGACPRLDDLLSRTMLLCVASVLTDQDVEDIITAYRKVATAIYA
ncbi:MAG TPA: hypothetical protein PKY77_21955 [Phycisphaerae bacterium]|nr:hypothetical protein [Phycisphaerae bacterium]HRY71240.1 hypothetical protein [Phycisphaerae bacterium]HSA29614.1 hypothetical protein [Phycisphaerae bacterium]